MTYPDPDRALPPGQVLGLAALTFGLLLLAAPERFEIAVLWVVKRGHGLSVLDLLAAVPILAGGWVVAAALWASRARLHTRGVGAGALAVLGAAGVVYGLKDTADWALVPSVVVLSGALLRGLYLARRDAVPYRSGDPSR